MMLERRKIEADRLPAVAVEKWNVKVLDEGFVPFPKRLIRCLGKLFGGEHGVEQLAVVLAIVDYRRPRLARPPSIEYLSFVAGMSVDTFKQHMGELQKRGWITTAGTDAEVEIGISGLLEDIVRKTPDEE